MRFKKTFLIILNILLITHLSGQSFALEISAGGNNLQNNSLETKLNSKVQSLIAVVGALGTELRKTHDCAKTGKIYDYNTDACIDNAKIKAAEDCTYNNGLGGKIYNFTTGACTSPTGGGGYLTRCRNKFMTTYGSWKTTYSPWATAGNGMQVSPYITGKMKKYGFFKIGIECE